MTKTNEEVAATGRRKCAVSSLRRCTGKGNIDVNGRPFEEYFPLHIQRETILAPRKMVEREERYDLLIRVSRGGIEGQVIATRLGVVRALVKENEEYSRDFKSYGFL